MPFPRLAPAVAALLLAAAPLGAQQPAPAAMSCTGTYAICGIRVEPQFFGGTKVLRGENAEQVGRLRGFGGSNLVAMVAGSDSAVAYARRYTNATRTSAVLGAVSAGLAIGAYLLVADESYDTGDESAASTMLIGSGVAGLVAGGYTLRAQRELSRSVWWYNREVTRRAPQ